MYNHNRKRLNPMEDAVRMFIMVAKDVVMKIDEINIVINAMETGRRFEYSIQTTTPIVRNKYISRTSRGSVDA
jgi:hypothetical protein